MTISTQSIIVQHGDKDIQLSTVISTPSTPAARPTLVLLHFWGGSHQTYGPLIDQLKDRFNIIAPSFRGWGSSSKPAEENAYYIRDHAADVRQLLVSIQRQRPELCVHGFVLVGHSMGGKVAQLLLSSTDAALAPLKGTVLLAPAPAGSFSLPPEMVEQQIHAYDQVETAKFVVGNVLLASPQSIDEQMIDEVAVGAVAGSAGARHAWPGYGMAEDIEADVVSGIKAKTAAGYIPKVLTVAGALDRVETPANVKAKVVKVLESAGADVRFVTLCKTGHLLPLEAPQHLAKLIETFDTHLASITPLARISDLPATILDGF